MNWISSNIDRIVSLTISHVWLTLIPTVVGLIIALPLGWWAHRFKRGQAAIVGTAGLLYTIPSLALFIILPTILGTKILDPVNIGIQTGEQYQIRERQHRRETEGRPEDGSARTGIRLSRLLWGWLRVVFHL